MDQSRYLHRHVDICGVRVSFGEAPFRFFASTEVVPMDAYDVFIEPSVVSHCLGCNFISPTSKHLIVAKTTILQVYEVQNINASLTSKPESYKLKLIQSFNLQGEITDLKPIRTIENPALDYLLVSTKSAKVSCVRWDVQRHTIATVSLHYYEHALQNLTYENIVSSRLIVGSNNKPVFCLRRNNTLVVVPFNRADEDDEDEGGDTQAANPDGDATAQSQNGNGTKAEDDLGAAVSSNMALFGSSIILDMSSLDSSIGEIIDMQFLHNYREPTVAILSERKETWAGLLPREKDNVIFSVLSLDLQNMSKTTILQIEALPFDLEQIVPLTLPLNGCFLVGCNEVIHVDSGGISRRVALNEYFTDCTSIKNFIDMSLKNFKLEDCSIVQIPGDNKVLFVLKTGEFFYFSFDVDGKTIKGLSLEEVDLSQYSDIILDYPGLFTSLDNNLIFLSGKSSNAALVQASYTSPTSPRDKPDIDQPMNEDDDDELYDDVKTVLDSLTRTGSLTFVKHDELINNGPISSFTFGQYSSEKFVANLPNPSFNEVSIFAAGGAGKLGHVNIMTPTIQLLVRSSLQFSQINRLWTINNKYLITSDDPNLKSEVFDIDHSYARLTAKHFIKNELTIGMHEMNHGKNIVQVTPKHIILFNEKFKPVADLEKEIKEFGDAYIINSVFNDDILMIFFSTGEVVIYSIDTYHKTFTRIELPKLLSDTIITTGYITNSRLLNVILKDVSVLVNRGQKRRRHGDVNGTAKSSITEDGQKMKIFVLVTGDNRVVVFSRYHNEKCFQLNTVQDFSDYLLLAFFDINGADPDPFIKQVILNDLGDGSMKDEYLTILTVGGEIFSYKMFFDGENYAFVKQYDLPITGAPFNAYSLGTSIERRMIYFPNFSGKTCIMITGVVPYMLTCSMHSQVKIFKFSKLPIVSFVPFTHDKIENGMIYLDTKKNARIVELSSNFSYDNNWPIRKIHIGETIKSIAFHESSHTVLLSTYKEIPYNCIDEEGNPIVGIKPDKPSAINYKGKILLVSSISWTIIDSIDLEDNEVGMQVKTMALDVGSETRRFKTKKEFVLVGTGKYRLEDLGCNGSYKLLEIIDIIPEPGKPETNHKFKELTKEDTKGAVTSICEVSGRFLVAQGQKIIVRDIKDNSAVSVAFMDLSVFVSETKSFGNLVIFGDTLKSVWLAGFDAEPFRMILLSKDLHGYDVCCADFLVQDEEVNILVADNDRRVHVLQYNPEDPASLNGQRLLHKASLNTNFTSTCMKSVPKHEQLSTWVDPSIVPFQTVASTVEGAMYTVFPTNEATYRRMYILQQQLTDKEYHLCGLNPRLNRFGGLRANTDSGSRPILDCLLLRKYAKLNQERQRTLGSKISVKNVYVDLWKDLIVFENVLNNL